MSTPDMPQQAPYPVEVTAGTKYFWCACGKSQNQPFCDGAHQGSDFTPHTYTADADKTVYFCGCKQTASAPLCDGAHNKLSND